jgi:hypothetical protein
MNSSGNALPMSDRKETEFETIINHIMAELEVAYKNTDIYYNSISRIDNFALELPKSEAKAKDTVNAPGTHLYKLKSILGQLTEINCKNSEIISHLEKLV